MFIPTSSYPTTQKFVGLYKAKYGDEPSYASAQGYNAAWYLARGIKAANSHDPQEIGKALEKITAMPSPFGPLTFDAGQGLISGELPMAVWKADGKMVPWRTN